jgi:hypothetical protein
MKRIAIIVPDQVALDEFNKCIERAITGNRRLVFTIKRHHKDNYEDMILYDRDNDTNEPWPWEEAHIVKYGDDAYVATPVYGSSWDGHVWPLGYVGTKKQIEIFEADVRAKLEVIDYPWELKLVHVEKV